ncbi:hypothetical protein NAPIS_ORF00661 [Vairimorpha apis BRL 01]|uniref:Uncharacterized protein n=1 Tax=Vairimorpha apis BRL 01 TaxID=1037528 RepID=T0L2I6_9MICR|nr:hypothetical protein NAPIS_ORF00661 [Vairimorpha apis BRL 01]
MKAYIKNNKLRFKSPVLSCIYKLNKIQNAIEDKNNDKFPYEEIQDFIYDCKKIIEETENIEIPLDYIEHINKNKEALNYFESKNLKSKNKEDIVNKQKDVFNKFKNGIKDFLDLLE